MSEYWYIEEANYRLYCLLCPIPISSLTWKNLAENLGIKRTLLTSLSMSILICTHQNLCVVEPLLLLFAILQSWQWEGQSGLKDIRQCETLMGEWCLSDVGWLPTCERLLTRFALAAFDDRWCQTHHLFAGESNHNRIFPFHVQPCQKSFCRLVLMF